MPWKECHVLDERKAFVLRALGGGESFVSLCEAFGISPKTGYKWKQRFVAEGVGGLLDHSRRPASSPSGLSEEQVCRIVRLRQAHRHWGARKLRCLYERAWRGEACPSESSFKRVLARAGLVEPRRRRRASETGRLQSGKVAAGPNEVWTVDFKGWWYTPAHQRCEPLTVRDAWSRYVLNLSLPGDARWQTVQRVFAGLFTRYGLPETIRSDNGSPFASVQAPLGLSRLSAWWVALGIDLDRTDPGHPEQNGSHERLHKDLAAELQGRIQGDLAVHASALELWREEYNQERPHEALGMRTPAELYCVSSRRFTGTPQRLDYGPGYLERQVHPQQGTISVSDRTIRISAALGGWNVGLRPRGDNRFAVHFGRLYLGELDVLRETLEVCPAGGRTGRVMPVAGSLSSVESRGRRGNGPAASRSARET